ncbi:MAG: hypothetical protein AB1481_05240 [Candidatus Omnitrophota bacterium]
MKTANAKRDKRMFWKPKTCNLCSAPLRFNFGIFDTLEGKQFNNPIETLYCKTHFIDTVKRKIANFKHPFIFYESLKYYNKYNQLFFYTVPKLPNHEYSKEDCRDTLNLLEAAEPEDEANVILIEGDAIKDAYDPPLFKIKSPHFKLIDKGQLLSILSNILAQLESVNPKGGFWFCPPYQERGIYLWFEV